MKLSLSGFDINAQDSFGKMPLHVACQHGIRENVLALINFSVRVCEDDATGSPSSEQGETTSLKQGPFCPRLASRLPSMQSRESIRSHSMRDSIRHSLHSLQSQGSSPSYDHTPSPGEGPGRLFVMHPVGRFLSFTDVWVLTFVSDHFDRCIYMISLIDQFM